MTLVLLPAAVSAEETGTGETYTLTYSVGSSTPMAFTYDAGTKVDITEYKYSAGGEEYFTFLGWSTEKQNGPLEYSYEAIEGITQSTITMNSNITLYPVYVRNPIASEVTSNAFQGSCVKVTCAKHPMNISYAPLREGECTFTDIKIVDATTVTSSVTVDPTLYVPKYWEGKNDGNILISSGFTEFVPLSEHYLKSADDAKGITVGMTYNFTDSKWYVDELVVINVTSDYDPMTITYTAGDTLTKMGDISVPEAVTTTDGTFTAGTATAQAGDGNWSYVLSYWQGSDGKQYTPGVEYKAADVTLTPVWKLCSINGDTTWNIDDALTIMQYVQDTEHNALAPEQKALIQEVTGWNEAEKPYDIDTALAIMQKIQNKELK
jgi:hypothetical protein